MPRRVEGVEPRLARGRGVDLPRHDLPDLTEQDITGSPFAIQAYQVRPDLGGEAALERVRERLAQLGLKLMLDFVPNHMSLDHPWVQEHPEFFIEGSEQDIANAPQNFISLETGRGPRILAHGRDPYFPGWSDTLQLNYRHAGLRAAMTDLLRAIARRCDGVRCDMAMLVLPEIFQRTWGDTSLPRDKSTPVDTPFWPEALARVRQDVPGFLFMAEAYWDREYDLQQQGFDFTYDKQLYDRLRGGGARAVRDHLKADPEYQRRSARFLENHDEPRAAATFSWPVHQAAAVISFLVPGLRFFHEGQFEGRKAHVSMHLGRRPAEPSDPAVQSFYRRLLLCLRRPEVHAGEWRQWDPRAAWDGNGTWDQFLVFSWVGQDDAKLLAAVNYGPARGQCYVTPGLPGLKGKRIVLKDLMSNARFERSGDELAGKGLYLDLEPWGYAVFEVAAS
ncbi:MAG: alpha-amylase [Deltaproteobacteria bacterium]|nr:alpha-amylase [Deltaproteobacteria bacterium]